MEFPFDVSHLASSPPALAPFPSVLLITSRHVELGSPRIKAAVGVLLDTVGRASATAQSLPTPITSASKLLANPDHHVYVCVDGKAALGFVKVGFKTLYVAGPATTSTSPLSEIRPLCVLDFFVAPAFRRQGIGRLLIDAMMANEGVSDASKLAFDRPSPMFLSFLDKHFGLRDYTPQSNNYVVFRNYWAVGGPHGGSGDHFASTSASLRGPPVDEGSSSRGGLGFAATHSDTSMRRELGRTVATTPYAATGSIGTAPMRSPQAGSGHIYGPALAAGTTGFTPRESASGATGRGASTRAPFATEVNEPLDTTRPLRRSPGGHAPPTTISLADGSSGSGSGREFASTGTGASPRYHHPTATSPLGYGVGYGASAALSPSILRVTPSARSGPVATQSSGWQGPGDGTYDRLGFGGSNGGSVSTPGGGGGSALGVGLGSTGRSRR